jgi:hypothetical protein
MAWGKAKQPGKIPQARSLGMTQLLRLPKNNASGKNVPGNK